MLLDIAKLPTAENSAIRLHPSDNVAIARVPVAPGTELRYRRRPRDRARTLSPPATRSLCGRSPPVRWFCATARPSAALACPSRPAATSIPTTSPSKSCGSTTNSPPPKRPPPRAPGTCPTFLGYLREDGRVGTRNYIAVVAASNCAAHTAETIARSYDGRNAAAEAWMAWWPFPHGEGCGHAMGPDVDQLRRTLGGVLAHPNVSAAVILGLGCEDNQIDHYLGEGAPRSDRLAGLTLQASGGTRGAVEAARRANRPFHRAGRGRAAHRNCPRPRSCWA